MAKQTEARRVRLSLGPRCERLAGLAFTLRTGVSGAAGAAVVAVLVDAALVRVALLVGIRCTLLVSSLVISLRVRGLLLDLVCSSRDCIRGCRFRVDAVLTGLFDTGASCGRLVSNGRACADSRCESKRGEDHTEASKPHRDTFLFNGPTWASGWLRALSGRRKVRVVREIPIRMMGVSRRAVEQLIQG